MINMRNNTIMPLQGKTNVPINYHNIMVDNLGEGGAIFFFNSCQHLCKGALLQWIE